MLHSRRQKDQQHSAKKTLTIKEVLKSFPLNLILKMYLVLNISVVNAQKCYGLLQLIQ